MTTQANYESYLNSMQNYSVAESKKDSQAESSDGFEAIFETLKEEKQDALTNEETTPQNSEPVEASDKSSDAVTQFLNDLRTKGAAQYLADLNQEKIDKLVEEYKDKLTKEMGESPENSQEIAKLVEDYKKQLLEEMREKSENEKISAGEKTPLVSKNSIVQMFLEMQQEKSTKPLEKLLA